MKGEALITVKDKNGKIKQQVKEKNLVFDIPKDLLKNYLGELDLGIMGAGCTGYAGQISSNYVAMLQIIDFKDWFRSIKVNDETCDTTDYTDWKMPVLYGGDTAKQQANRTRYAALDGNNSSISTNIMKQVWTWTGCPNFTIRSLNLGHKRVQTDTPMANIPDRALSTGQEHLVKYGKFYFRKQPVGNNDGLNVLGGVTVNALYEKGDAFNFSLDYGRKAFTKTLQVGSSYGSSNGIKYTHIYSLANNEIALLRYNNDLTTDESGQGSTKYLIIIDANSGAIKRSFPLTQFDGFVGGGANYRYVDNQLIRILATSFGNFIVMPKNQTNANYFVWKIPEQSEMSNYSNNESISVYADLSSTGFIMYVNNSYRVAFVLNEFLFLVGSTYASDLTIRINDDAQNPYTVYDYVPFNNGTSGNSDYEAGVFNKYYKDVYRSWETWYNTTVLNLSEGVEVSQGDTLTIEYTVTAN